MTNFHDDPTKNKKALLNLVEKCTIGMNGIGRFKINSMRKQIVSSETVPHSLSFYYLILIVWPLVCSQITLTWIGKNYVVQPLNLLLRWSSYQLIHVLINVLSALIHLLGELWAIPGGSSWCFSQHEPHQEYHSKRQTSGTKLDVLKQINALVKVHNTFLLIIRGVRHKLHCTVACDAFHKS